MDITAYGDRGSLTFDGHTVTITTEASFSTTRGDAVQRITVDQITAVDLKPAGVFASGRISFAVPGASSTARLSSMGILGGVNVRSAYSVTFPKSSQDDMEALRDAVQAAIERRDTPPDEGAAGLLSKLADLHHAGVLTDEEFAAAKGRALTRI